MAETKIIKAVFGISKSIVTKYRYRYDYGQIIEISGVTLPDPFEARFSNSPTGESIRVLGSNQRVEIPKPLMRSGQAVWCYIMVHDGPTDGRTMYTICVPLKDATEPTDIEPTPEEYDIISQAVSELNTARDKWENMSVKANTLSPGSEATAEYEDGVLTLGIPRGRNGDGEGGGGIDDLGVVGGMLCVTYIE